jgi:hypothetical protein
VDRHRSTGRSDVRDRARCTGIARCRRPGCSHRESPCRPDARSSGSRRRAGCARWTRAGRHAVALSRVKMSCAARVQQGNSHSPPISILLTTDLRTPWTGGGDHPSSRTTQPTRAAPRVPRLGGRRCAAGVVRGVLTVQSVFGLACPARRIGSGRVATAPATNVIDQWLRSCQVRSSRPMARSGSGGHHTAAPCGQRVAIPCAERARPCPPP